MHWHGNAHLAAVFGEFPLFGIRAASDLGFFEFNKFVMHFYQHNIHLIMAI